MEKSLSPIILIEDDSDLLNTYVNLLEKKIPEYDLLAYTNGADGAQALCEQTPSLVVSDLRLPNIDGIQILWESISRHPAVPVIIISGFFALDQIKETVRETVDDTQNITFISKPFDPSMFGSYIEGILTSGADSTINGISLLNIMQIINADQKSCYLELLEGEQSGVVSFTDGEVCFARTDHHRGIEAIMEMCEWNNPVILIFNNRKTSKVNIESTSIDDLLLKIVHHLDEL